MLAHDGVVVREPDAREREEEVLALGLEVGQPGEDGVELLRGGAARVGHCRRQVGRGGLDHARHDAVEQGRLGVEVVVEGALGRRQLVDHVLDAELGIALGRDEPLGGVQERLAPHGVGDRVECPGHDPPIKDRLTVYFRPTTAWCRGVIRP
jgi:hypothetical protein